MLLCSRAALLLLLLLGAGARAFVLRLDSTEQRCVFDVLKADMLCSGYYAASGEGVRLQVLDPFGEPVFATPQAGEGKFSFIAKTQGRHEICATNTHLVARQVELRVKSGVEAEDLSEVAQQDHLVPLSVELLRLEQVAGEIRAELGFLFRSEADMRELNAETSARVRASALFSAGVILCAGLWQYRHVRAFLAAKKVG